MANQVVEIAILYKKQYDYMKNNKIIVKQQQDKNRILLAKYVNYDNLKSFIPEIYQYLSQLF